MIDLTIKNGVINSVKGDPIEVLAMDAAELSGLPYSLIDSQALSPGVYTRYFKKRTGEKIPVQLSVFELGSGYHVWADAFSGVSKELSVYVMENLFRSISTVSEYGDPGLQDHLSRVSGYATFFASKILGWNAADAKRLEIAALVHDVGKTGIPREILYKPGKFSWEEKVFVQRHSTLGFEIIRTLESRFKRTFSWMYDKELFQFAKDVTLHHHENFDGSGYPMKLAGKDIPLAARIVKLVDVIDALMSDRPYKNAWTWPETKKEIVSKTGVEFDPELVSTFFQHEEEFLNCMPHELALGLVEA